MQPTLQAFLKRTATGATAGATTSSSTSTVVQATLTNVSTASKVSKASSVAIDSDVGDDKKNKRVKVTGNDADETEQRGDVSTTITTATTTTLTKIQTTTTTTWVDAEIDRLDDSNKWKAILKREAVKSRTLFSFLSSLPEKNILPPKPKVFNAFHLCPFDEVKVVILGQDPYHGANQAHGLAFSVMDGIPPPPSLKNIFKEAINDVGAKPDGKSGNLEYWAKQGVLLLNALLTVEPGTPMAHKAKGWEKFTDACIAELSKGRSNLVFMLWGKPAQEKGKMVDKKKHLIITSSHPSPLGASQTSEPFLGSKCFSRCNAYLSEHGMGEIDWNLKPK